MPEFDPLHFRSDKQVLIQMRLKISGQFPFDGCKILSVEASVILDQITEAHCQASYPHYLSPYLYCRQPVYLPVSTTTPVILMLSAST